MNRERLWNRSLGRIDVMALGFGTVVGWSWVMMAGEWVAAAGFGGAIVAFCICAGVFLLLASLYGELASALPLAGGEFVYVYRGLGQGAARLVGFILAFAYIGIAALEAVAVSTAFHHLFSMPERIVLWNVAGHSVSLTWILPGLMGCMALSLLNYLGTRAAIIFQIMATAAMILIGLLFLFGGVSFGSAENMGPPLNSGTGIAHVMLAVPVMLIGFSVLTQSAEEMNIPKGGIPKAMVGLVLLCCLWYILVILAISMSTPAAVRDGGFVPTADAMAYAFGDPAFRQIMIFGGLMGILTTWNGFFLAGTRVLFAMGRAKMLPACFSRVHPVHGTPPFAIALVGGICCLGLMLGENSLDWLVRVSGVGIMVSYFFVSISYLVLKAREPELYRPFQVKRGKLVGMAAAIATAVYLVLYGVLWESGIGTFGLPIFIGWAALAGLLTLWSRRVYGKVSPGEREKLIFGLELSRRGISRDEEEGEKP